MVELKLHKPRTIISFDFGYVRIGVAVGQELTATASPLTTLTKRAQDPDWDTIGELIAQWQPALLVVGIPHHADGSPNAITTAAMQFCRQLKSRYQLPVETIDEHLSSREAEHRIGKPGIRGGRLSRKRPSLDQEAAAVILETWFNQFYQCRKTAHATRY